MLRAAILPIMLLLSTSTAAAAPTPRNVPIKLECSGAVAAAGRKLALANKLTVGADAKACFGQMSIYEGNNREFVVVAPSAKCPGKKVLDVYSQSRAGSWYSFFEKPICGNSLSIGPKDPWGDWMLTIDGRHYDSRGAYYVPVDY